MSRLKKLTRWTLLPVVLLLLIVGAVAMLGRTEPPPRAAANFVDGRAWSATGMGSLAERLDYGADEIWSASMHQNIYTLENRTGEHAVRYYTNPDFGPGGGKRSISVDVALHEGSQGRAGLIYALNRERNTYMLFVLEADGSFTSYLRHDTGIDHMGSVKPEPSDRTFHRLEMREQGGRAQLWANGRRIATTTVAGISQGEVGIVAFGVGVYGFTNYAELEDNGWRD